MSRRFVARAVSVLVMFAVAGDTWANPKPRFFGYEEWDQAVIERQLDPGEVVYPFEAPPEMMAWAEEKLQPHAQKDGILQLTVLQNALFNTSYSVAPPVIRDHRQPIIFPCSAGGNRYRMNRILVY